jgi:hypothetical protein
LIRIKRERRRGPETTKPAEAGPIDDAYATLVD